VRRCCPQHHYAGRPSWLVGRSLAGYRTWDGIRAVDALLQRPEVDPNRLAVVGNSGGGQMALLIAAADERIQVCAAAHPGGPMENTYLTGKGLVDRDLLGLIAPRPCIFIVGDESKGIQSFLPINLISLSSNQKIKYPFFSLWLSVPSVVKSVFSHPPSAVSD